MAMVLMVMVEVTSGMRAVMVVRMTEQMPIGGVDGTRVAVPGETIVMLADGVVARRFAMAGGAVVWPMAAWRPCPLLSRSRRGRSWRAQVGSVSVLMTIPWLGCLETGRLLTRARLGGLLVWTR
jgi:hypothetical protein